MLANVVDLTEALEHDLPWNDRYRVVTWKNGKVYISYSRKGNAVTMHIAAKGRNKRYLREAAEAFCRLIFFEFEWCKMIIGIVGSRSVVNLAKKCGFTVVKEGIKDGEPVALVARIR